MDEVTAAVEVLEFKRRIAGGIVAAHVAVYAVALILFAFGKWTPALVLLGINLLIYLFAVRRTVGGYARAATEANLRYGLCAPLEDVEYQPKGGMDRTELERWAMLPLEGDLLCRHFVAGRGWDMELTCNETAFHYAAPDEKGKETHRFLSGTLLTARGPSDARPGDWLLLRENLLEPGAREEFLRAGGYRSARGAPEGFLLYARRPGEQLPDYLTRRVTKLCSEMKRLGALRLAPDGAAAYLDLRFYTGSAYPTTHPSAARLRENTLAERDDLWALFRFWFTVGNE